MKLFRDAIHGDMEFDRDEVAVLDAPAMQRLRGIKQLGASSLVFPGAVHTRFEHSLGACWLTQRLLAGLAKAGTPLRADDARAARLAALLHDVTHVPFGHTFEDERRLFPRHDEDPGRLDFFLSQPALKSALGSQHGEVRALLGPAGKKAPGAQLCAGAVGADLLDYLHRDALHCGLALRWDERLLGLFRLADGKLALKLHKAGVLRRDALSELLHLLQMRYVLTERVYYHHAKVVAGAMVSRALELALEAGVLCREDLYALRDDSLLDRLATAEPRRAPGAAALARDVLDRRLCRRVYQLGLAGLGREGATPAQRDALAAEHHFDPARRRAAERTLATRWGVPESDVIVYCPAPSMAMKEADVPVEIAPGTVRPLSDLGHPDVAGLREKHAGLWRLLVCVRRPTAEKIPDPGAACAELFGQPNQLSR
jgi:uncharacterized protein